MTEYKRLTETKKINEYCSTVECGEHCEDCYAGNLYERLAELEDKIENGTLIPVESLNEQGYYKSEGLGWNNPIWIVLIMSMLSGNIDVSKLPPDVQDELNKLKEKDNDR